MSDIFQEFVKRRSIRRYTEEPIADDLLRRILEECQASDQIFVFFR